MNPSLKATIKLQSRLALQNPSTSIRPVWFSASKTSPPIDCAVCRVKPFPEKTAEENKKCVCEKHRSWTYKASRMGAMTADGCVSVNHEGGSYTPKQTDLVRRVFPASSEAYRKCAL